MKKRFAFTAAFLACLALAGPLPALPQGGGGGTGGGASELDQVGTTGRKATTGQNSSGNMKTKKKRRAKHKPAHRSKPRNPGQIGNGNGNATNSGTSGSRIYPR